MHRVAPVVALAGSVQPILALAVAALVAAPATAQSPRYEVVDMGVFPGASSLPCPCFRAEGISPDGAVIGSYIGLDGQFMRGGFLAAPGREMVDLGALFPVTVSAPMDSLTEARGVNSSHEVVGFSGQKAFIWRDGAMAPLTETDAIARDINESGHVVGALGVQSLPSLAPTPFLFDGSAVIQLDTFGGRYGEAMAINEQGHAAGWASYPVELELRHAALWRDGEIIPLGELDPGQPSAAEALNEAGQVVGMGWIDKARPGSDRWHAFLWDSSHGMIDLGNLPEAGTIRGYFGPLLVNTVARDINNRGQIVGDSSPGPILGTDPGRPGPWIWQDGVMINLNDLIDPASGWLIESAAGINDRGQIAATARLHGGDPRAVRLDSICIADCDGSGGLDFFDFLCFQNAFAAGAPYADCDGSGVLDFFDFLCFQNEFAAGCP